jgi:hypothetical protein
MLNLKTTKRAVLMTGLLSIGLYASVVHHTPHFSVHMKQRAPHTSGAKLDDHGPTVPPCDSCNNDCKQPQLVCFSLGSYSFCVVMCGG